MALCAHHIQFLLPRPFIIPYVNEALLPKPNPTINPAYSYSTIHNNNKKSEREKCNTLCISALKILNKAHFICPKNRLGHKVTYLWIDTVQYVVCGRGKWVGQAFTYCDCCYPLFVAPSQSSLGGRRPQMVKRHGRQKEREREESQEKREREGGLGNATPPFHLSSLFLFYRIRRLTHMCVKVCAALWLHRTKYYYKDFSLYCTVFTGTLLRPSLAKLDSTTKMPSLAVFLLTFIIFFSP